MLTEYQAALTRRVKARLREDVGYPLFERRDPTIPPIPTLDEVVAGSDSSPAYLLCQKCRGELLAGIKSHICIYCGSRQRKDVLPPSMSFTSTVSYRRFLESLQFDGSEVISLNTDTKHSTSHHDAPKKDLPLSELLDFELKWPQGSEDLDKKSESKTLVPTTSYVNLDGVNLENFFVKTTTEITQSASVSSCSKRMVSIPSEEFHFDMLKKAHDKTVGGASESGAFSSWKAEFGTDTSGSETASAGSSFNNLEATTGAVQNKETHLAMDNNGKSETSTEVFSKDRSEDITFGSHMNDTNSINQTKQNDNSLVDWGEFSVSAELSFPMEIRTQDTILESDIEKKDNADQTKENHNALDDWQDFTSSRDTPDPSLNSWSLTGAVFSHESVMKVNSIGIDHNSVQETGDAGAGNMVQVAIGSKNKKEGSFQTKQFPFSGSEFDASFGGNSQENSSNDIVKEGEDSLDDWQYFAGSGDVPGSSLGRWSPASSAFSQEPAKHHNSANLVQGTETVDLKDAAAGRTTGAGPNELLEISADPKDSIEESSNSKKLPVSNSEFDVLFGGNLQGPTSSCLMRQGEDSLNDWQDFAGSTTMVWITGDSKDKNEESVDPKQSLVPDSGFDAFFGGLSQEHSISGLIKESDDLEDDWQDFTGSGDVPAPSSSVWPSSCSSISQEPREPFGSANLEQEMETIEMNHIVAQKTTVAGSDAVVEISADSKEKNGKSNQSDQLLFSSSEFDAFFGGISEEHKGNGLPKEGDDSVDDWQDFAGFRDMSGSFSSVWPLPVSSVSLESSKRIESSNVIQEDHTINIGHNTIQETVDAGSNKVLQSTDDILKNKESDQPEQLLFLHSAFDELFGEASREDNSNSVMKESDDALYDWQDFAGPPDVPGPSSSAWSLASSTVSQALSKQIDSVTLVQDGPTKENDDALDDEWQDFADSGDKAGTSSTSWSLSGSTVAQEPTKQIESVNPLQQMESTKYAHANPFSGMHINEGSGSITHLPPVLTHFDRVRDTEGKPDFSTGGEIFMNHGSNSVATTTSNSADSSAQEKKVGMLISEMHDLSFMLENQLRIPEKHPGSD